MKNRQLDLLLFLLKNKKSTRTELAQMFEVSKKTIERDIDRLSLAGVPVFCQQGSGGGVYIDAQYKFGTSFFSPEDIAHIVVSLNIAKSFTANEQGDEILQKMALAEPNLMAMFESNIRDYFSVDIYSEPVDFESGIYLEINKCLDFKLHARIDGKLAVCLGYVYKPDGIYLFCHMGDYELCKIDEIESFTVKDTSFDGDYLPYRKYKTNREMLKI